ncbi:MAG TPA: DoxX family protein [Kofleriaceae bacterium]|jgi:putative oxidoreductase
MTALAPIGRVLFALIFILALPSNLSHQAVVHATQAGVPLARVAVPIAGVLACVGGLSVALGFHARIGALLIAIFLIPVTLYMHRFWGLGDLQVAHAQQASFMKNLGLLGAALYIIFSGAGPYSFDAKAGRDGALQAPGHW